MSEITQYVIKVLIKAALINLILWGAMWLGVKLVVKFNLDAVFRGLF